MRRPCALIAGVALTLSAVTSAGIAAEIPGSAFSYGNWSGAGFTNDQTGQFSSCGVSASYVSGETLVLTVNADATITVGVINENWSLLKGQTFNISVHIDSRKPFYGVAEAFSEKFAFLRIPEFERALRAIQKGYTMTIRSDTGWVGRYDLSGTYRALEKAKQCAYRFYEYPRVAAPQPGPSQPGGSMSAPSGAPVDPAYLYQLATVMIAETGVQDFRYLTEQEKEPFGFPNAVFWISESQGILGAVLATRVGDDADLSTLGAEDIRSIAQGCAGDVVTGSRAIQQANFPGREIRAACSAGDDSYEAYLTKTLVDDILIEVLLYFQGDPTEAMPERRELSEDIRIRTASFVTETPTR